MHNKSALTVCHYLCGILCDIKERTTGRGLRYLKEAVGQYLDKKLQQSYILFTEY